MRNYFTFGGIDSRDYGVYISGEAVFNFPEREVEAISVPGRNGDMLGVSSRLANIELTYPAFIYSDFKTKIRTLRDVLIAKTGYQQLTDSYHDDEFRQAYFVGDIEVEPTQRRDAGNFELLFVCKPQRWLTSGQTEVSVSAGGTITNPTRQFSQPLIHVTGYGNLYINSGRMTIANTYPDVYIDCEMMDCYYMDGATAVNANDSVSIREVDFPTLRPGSNSVTYADTITAVTFVPRWWRA